MDLITQRSLIGIKEITAHTVSAQARCGLDFERPARLVSIWTLQSSLFFNAFE
jgi:hypothetical protein